MKTPDESKMHEISFELPRLFLLSLVFLTVSGCTLPHRGMMGDNLYISNQSPAIQISVNEDYLYAKGKNGEFQHQFVDSENHRFVYIQHVLHDINENVIDYYEDPEHWIYLDSSDNLDLERFTMKKAGEKWYVQDFVHHASTASCLMVRKLSAFTSRHDMFHLMYFWEMPPYRCKDWKVAETLSEDQQSYINQFHEGFARDILIEQYVKK